MLRAPTHYCVPEGAGLVSTICDMGFDHFQPPVCFYSFIARLVLLRILETMLLTDVSEMLFGRTSFVSVIVISSGRYQNPHGLLSLLLLDLPKQCSGNIRSTHFDDLTWIARVQWCPSAHWSFMLKPDGLRAGGYR